MRISRILRNTLVSLFLVATISAQSTTTAPTSSVSKTIEFNIPTTKASTAAATAATTAAPAPTPAPTTSAGNSTSIHKCPGPLLPNINNLTIYTCVGRCCVPCPAVNSFYEPGRVDGVLNAAFVTRQISLVFVFFLMISYMVLPGKRAQPHISVLFLTVSLTLWYASFDVMPGVSNACINDYEQSTGRNSRLCGAQGVLIIYLTQTCCLWCALLIYKLHLLAVWRSDIIDQYYGWLTGFCWIFPLAFAIPVAVKNLSQYPGIGFSCLVSTDNLNTYLFYPIGVYVYPAMVVHIVTVAKMIHLAVLSSKIDNGLSQLSASSKFASTMQAKRLLRGQWRPALMLFMTMAAITVFWLFYFIEGHRLALITPKTPFVLDWYLCLLENDRKGLSSFDTQTVCAKRVAQHLPSIPWLGVAELILALVGVVVTLVFISKREFWEEWGNLLRDTFRRGKSRTGSRGRSDSGSGGGDPKPEMERGYPDASQHQYVEPNVRKIAAARVGYNDTLPAQHSLVDLNGEFKKEYRNINDNPETMQWPDMDDLLDKEYELQDTDLSHGSMVAPISGHRGQQTSAEIPLTLGGSSQGDHHHSNEIMYAPAVPETDSNHAWTSNASTLSGPAKSYLVANDTSDRYMEQPVVPRPVPRAGIKAKQLQEPIFLSSPTHSPRFAQTSLSPMPQKAPSPLSSASLSYQESVPLAGGSGAHGSPTMAYTHTSGSTPSLMRTSPHNSSEVPSITGVSAGMYNPNESADNIMAASRESLNRGPNKGYLQESPLGRSNSGRTRTKPGALDTSGAKSPPPSIPIKSPARFNSPTGSTPTSPTQLYLDQQQHNEYR